MPICTFFGHRDCFGLDAAVLRSAIEDLINQGVDTFYVGNQGRFDACVRGVLRQLQAEYPQIHYAVVLAYMPGKSTEYDDNSDTMFPEGLEDGPPKFAIDRRNRWLVRESDYVICCVHYSWGGAYKFAQLAKKRGKKVINLCDPGVEF